MNIYSCFKTEIITDANIPPKTPIPTQKPESNSTHLKKTEAIKRQNRLPHTGRAMNENRTHTNPRARKCTSRRSWPPMRVLLIDFRDGSLAFVSGLHSALQNSRSPGERVPEMHRIDPGTQRELHTPRVCVQLYSFRYFHIYRYRFLSNRLKIYSESVLY